jgi:hypothetical protein
MEIATIPHQQAGGGPTTTIILLSRRLLKRKVIRRKGPRVDLDDPSILSRKSRGRSRS